jgi:hypothetical protein
MARNCGLIMDGTNNNVRICKMRKRADFHKLEFIFSLGIISDMLNNLTLN